MEDEREQRQWAIYKDQRIKIDGAQAWSLLGDGIRQEVLVFNRTLEKAGHNPPLVFEDGERLLTIKKDAYPSHRTQIMLELPERAFVIFRTSSLDAITPPKEEYGTVKLDLRSDDKLYLSYRGEQHTAFSLPRAIMKEIFKAVA